MGDKLTASEAVYGFCGWLTTRKQETRMGENNDCAPIADLIDQFCNENRLPDPVDGWEKNLIHPKNECSKPVTMELSD